MTPTTIKILAAIALGILLLLALAVYLATRPWTPEDRHLQLADAFKRGYNEAIRGQKPDEYFLLCNCHDLDVLGRYDSGYDLGQQHRNEDLPTLA